MWSVNGILSFLVVKVIVSGLLDCVLINRVYQAGTLLLKALQLLISSPFSFGPRSGCLGRTLQTVSTAAGTVDSPSSHNSVCCLVAGDRFFSTAGPSPLCTAGQVEFLFMWGVVVPIN